MTRTHLGNHCWERKPWKEEEEQVVERMRTKRSTAHARGEEEEEAKTVKTQTAKEDKTTPKKNVGAVQRQTKQRGPTVNLSRTDRKPLPP